MRDCRAREIEGERERGGTGRRKEGRGIEGAVGILHCFRIIADAAGEIQ